MRRHTDQALITASLRDLDPGGATDLSAAERERADAAFDCIVATPTDGHVAEEPDRPHRLRWRLLAPLALAGAAGIGMPVLLLGGGSAYGTWTQTPTTLTGEAAAAAGDTCRSALQRNRSQVEEAVGPQPNSDTPLRVAVAERRGDWTYVLLAGPRTEGICLMPNDAAEKDHGEPESLFSAYGTDVAAPPTLAPDRIVERTSAEGSTDEGWFNWLEGYVGSDVTGVTVHTSSGLDIEASVVGDRFAAWWPGVVQSSHNSEAETWSYTVHLADGSTRRTSCSQSTHPC